MAVNYCMVNNGDDVVKYVITTPDYNYNVRADDDVDYDENRYDDDGYLCSWIMLLCHRFGTLYALIIYYLLQHFFQLSLASSALLS